MGAFCSEDKIIWKRLTPSTNRVKLNWIRLSKKCCPGKRLVWRNGLKNLAKKRCPHKLVKENVIPKSFVGFCSMITIPVDWMCADWRNWKLPRLWLQVFCSQWELFTIIFYQTLIYAKVWETNQNFIKNYEKKIFSILTISAYKLPGS